MKAIILAVAASAAMLAAGAQAQGWRGRPPPEPRATLYELPGFQGRQVSVSAVGENLAKTGFNDIAQSARLEGRWRLCEDSGYRGRCQDVSGDVPDLAAVGLSLKVSSLQAYLEGAWSRGASWRDGPEGEGRPFEGARNVLFPYPTVAGFDIAGDGGSADAFCRSMRLGSAVYYDTGEQAALALDRAGRYVGDTGVLRDVLCRRP